MPTLYLIIGIPGAGKSMKAREIIANSKNLIAHYEADMFFEQDGQYNFNRTLLWKAHLWCQQKTEEAMKTGVDVIVSNTSLTPRERRVYLALAKQYHYNVEVITCTGNYKNIHGVPDETLERMKERFVPYTEQELENA